MRPTDLILMRLAGIMHSVYRIVDSLRSLLARYNASHETDVIQIPSALLAYCDNMWQSR